MGIFSKIKAMFVTPVVQEKEEAGLLCKSGADMVKTVWSHIKTLFDLLKLELKESAGRLGKKFALLALTLFMAVFGYLFVWCFLTVLMAHFWGGIIACAITAAFHVIVAIIAAIGFTKTHVAPIAPATVEELKTDLTCIKMSLKKNLNS